MTGKWFKGLFWVGSILILSASAWAQRGTGRGMHGFQNNGNCQAAIDTLPKQDLNSTEAAGLTYLREEEKLARDVYTTLLAKWGSPVFENIARSEQQHMNAIKILLDRYGLPDPAANTAVGTFSNSDLQDLYGSLIAQGQSSIAAAFRVGATIEDLDIHDLDKALAATDNDDLKLVYGNLQKASLNHMRAFVGQLQSLGETYKAQYISDEELTNILATSCERGMGDGRAGSGCGCAGQHNGTPGSCPNCTGQCAGTCPWGSNPSPASVPGPRRP